jgi:hypothetical protein
MTKPKTADDPVFAAIAEHKALTRESDRLEAATRIARDRAEKKHGEWIEHVRRRRSENRSAPDDWPGRAIIDPPYDRWNCAERAERKAAMRMARTKPTTATSAAAMITHARRAFETGSKEDWQDWGPTALKTVAAALAVMRG